MSVVILMCGCSADSLTTSAPVYPDAPSTATLQTSFAAAALAVAGAGGACAHMCQGWGVALDVVRWMGLACINVARGVAANAIKPVPASRAASGIRSSSSTILRHT